jgi:hypothetical protein
MLALVSWFSIGDIIDLPGGYVSRIIINPKQYQNPNALNSKDVLVIGIWEFEFVQDLEIRIYGSFNMVVGVATTNQYQFTMHNVYQMATFFY